MRDLRALPKVELHVHLEGAMRASTVVELAKRYGVELPEGLREGRYDFRDFRHFIDEWVAGLACLRSPEDFHRIALEFCEDEAAQGVRYAEVSFSLPDHAEKFDDWDGPMEGALEGFAEGERRFGIACRMYVDVVRGIDMALSRRAMEVAARYRDAGVIGIGLGGEERFAPEPYASIFRDALALGLHSIPHAGETHGPASIRGAVEALGAERIGHGIRIARGSGARRGGALAWDRARRVPDLERDDRFGGEPAGASARGDARHGAAVHARERRPLDVPLVDRGRVRGLPARARVRRRAPREAGAERGARVLRRRGNEDGARAGHRRLARGSGLTPPGRDRPAGRL